MTHSFYASVPYLFLRIIGSPITDHRSPVTNPQSPLLPGHSLGRILDRVNDVRVTGATTQISFQRMSDLLAAGFGISLEQLHPGDDHSGRAIAALQTMAFPESLLNRVQFPVP